MMSDSYRTYLQDSGRRKSLFQASPVVNMRFCFIFENHTQHLSSNIIPNMGMIYL